MPIRDVSFQRTPRGVTLQGTTTPNATVTAENLSAAPFGPAVVKDTFSSVQADAQGRFQVVVPLAVEGDKVGLKAGRGRSSILSVRLEQAGVTDGRRAEVGHQGLRLTEVGPGSYGFSNVRKSKRLGEPGATLQLVNRRTGESTSFELDARGRLPKNATVKGQPGDTFTLGVSDGVHTKYLKDGWSALTIPAAPDAKGVVEPLLTDAAKRTRGERIKLEGPLFKDGPQLRDAEQGQLGDCYIVATAASLAANRPDVLQKMFKDNADGTVTVTFKSWDDDKRGYVDTPITVTREVPKHWNGMLYGSDDDSRDPKTMECWFPMLEKAFAAWKGSYDAIECGYPYEVFEAMMGTEGVHIDTRGVSADSLWKTLEDAVDGKAPTLVWTGGEAPERRFTNSGLYGDHAYSLVGISEENGTRMVTLRNPWGKGEPRGNGADDGVFSIPLKDFQTYFVGVGVAH